MVKKIIQVTAFLLVGAVLFGYISSILSGKWLSANKETYTTDGLYELERDCLDVFVLGTSHVVTGISPMAMYEEYGISAYTLGMGHAPMSASYYWLKECHKRQNLSTVVFDVSILYKSVKEKYFRRAFDPMKLSWDKAKVAYEYSKEKDADSFASYLFPIITWHSRWKDLTEEDFRLKKEDSLVYRGNVMKSKVDPEVDYNKIIIDNDEQKELPMKEEQLKYFEKFVSYCSENNLNLVLIKTPKESWTLAESEGVRKLAEKYDLPFLDFNYEEMVKEVGIDTTTDLRDKEHMNLKGAEKVSLYLGKYLKEHYDLKDYREEKNNPVDMERYHQDRDDVYLQLSQDVEEYLNRLNNSRYGVVLQMTDDISGYWTQDLQEALEELGLQVNVSGLAGLNYAGVLEQGTCVYEEYSAEPLVLPGAFASKNVSFKLESNINKEKNDVKIEVNGQEELFKMKGLNVLVYDLEKDRIINEAVIYKSSKEDVLEIKHIYSFE